MRLLSFALVALAMLGCLKPAVSRGELDVVSSHADFVTGGDALFSRLPEGAVLQVNGVPLSAEVRGQLTYVSGLPMGEHELTAHLDGQLVARLAYTTYPLQGPMISGPHEEPFYCETETFEIGPGAGTLGSSAPPLCVVSTREDRFAVNAEGKYFASVEQSVVSVETGVINRAVYQIARPDNWNGKLIYKFGGGCRAGWYRQGDVTGGVLDHYMFERGYAVASATLNVSGVNCNDLLAAETMMMVKERFIEQYGVPEWH
jgi:Tannase-like family of unknown function (DUF6351)